ncbi:hypothetical protein D6827_01965 [Candidatus Parcubacteria bacterium]|nr:MAG: hypothetical protein D6827_01965 [Candidatus Parcubacteria bacterium]
MKVVDDRNTEQKYSHYLAVLATDRFLSGWGLAEGGNSYIAFACRPEDLQATFRKIQNRNDLMRIRVVDLRNYRPNPKYCKHLHIYLAD